MNSSTPWQIGKEEFIDGLFWMLQNPPDSTTCYCIPKEWVDEFNLKYAGHDFWLSTWYGLRYKTIHVKYSKYCALIATGDDALEIINEGL